MSLAQVFFELTTTVRPSNPIGISTNSTPLDLLCCASSWLMGRDASQMWIVPSQNLRSPPPVPETDANLGLFPW